MPFGSQVGARPPGASWIFQWRLLETLIRRRSPPRIARPQPGEDREEFAPGSANGAKTGACGAAVRPSFRRRPARSVHRSRAGRHDRESVSHVIRSALQHSTADKEREAGRQASDRQCAIPDGAPDSCRGGVALIRSRDTRFAWVLTAGIAVGGRIHLDLSRCGRHPDRCRRHRHRALPRGRRPAGYPGPDRQPGSTRPPPTTGPTHCSRRSGSSSSSRGAPKRCFSATRRRPGPQY